MTEFYASCNEFPSIRHKISTSVTSTIPIKPVKRVIQTGVSVDSRYPSTDYDECDEMDHEMDQPTELMHSKYILFLVRQFFLSLCFSLTILIGEPYTNYKRF